jgi:hypothetical protein
MVVVRGRGASLMAAAGVFLLMPARPICRI